MPNALLNQSSPYLNQASNQPVEWEPWGKAAFDKAKKLDKPVIVSIGYASCHWCRQMERDNYEDRYIASIMNRYFVCIKVDREERPDLDHFYMEASRMFNQSAGWPLHAFCLPDGSPFWCGTYFPKEDTGNGIAPWPQVLLRIAEHYKNFREELIENGKNALANLVHSNNSNLGHPSEWKNEMLIDAAKILSEAHDDLEGGFTPSPKFPSSMKMDFLFALNEAESVRQNLEFSMRLDFCVNKTLEAIANGSLFDHVNGGFFRYCLDRKWSSPHFEKMLSDNALLISTFSRSWRKFHNPRDRKILEKTLSWIEREMGNPSIGYAGSLSAESNEMEGGHYLWEYKEMENVIGEKEAKKAKLSWGPFANANTDFFLPRTSDENEISFEKQEAIFQKLHQARQDCKGPQRDEKRSCFQNALIVRAFIDAGVALGDKSYIEKSKELLMWMESTFTLTEGGISSMLYPDQTRSKFAFLEDYTFWAEAVLSFATISEVWKLGKSKEWINKAESLIKLAMAEFRDHNLAGYFTSSEKVDYGCLVRKKSWYDHAIPSGNSSLLRCFSILSVLGTEKVKWQREYEEALSAYSKIVRESPDGIGHALSSISDYVIGIVQIKGPIQFISEMANELKNVNYRTIYLVEDAEVSVHINNKNADILTKDPLKIIQALNN